MDDGQTLVVEQLLIDSGKVRARVLTERVRPLDVTLYVDQWDEQQWEHVLTLLTTEASYIASLLNDQWPMTLTRKLNALNLNTDIHFIDHLQSCPCTGENETLIAKSDRCIHIEATEQMLRQRIAAKPLLVFKLRGMAEEALFAELRHRRSEVEISDHIKSGTLKQAEPYKSYVDTSLPIAKLLPEGSEPLFWREEVSLHTAMRPIYRLVSERARQIQLRHGLHHGRND